MKDKEQIMLSFSHVAVSYGDKMVLKDISFQVGKGEYVALIGSNGTGKSTLIKCVSGLLPHYRRRNRDLRKRQQKIKDQGKSPHGCSCATVLLCGL